jgi:general secretion pathway protein A
MFEHHFGLRENPFVAGHHTRFVYPSPEHQEALAHLRFGIENREPFVLISGEVGTGKTTALYDALSEWQTKVVVALINNSQLTRIELLEEISLRLGVLITSAASKPQILAQLERTLLAIHQRGDRALLLLDEAQNLEPELLEEIRLLSNLEVEGQKLLQIFLIGQPELEVKLTRPELRQLRQRITVHYRLSPLNEDDTERYIHHRISVAGGNANDVFPHETCLAVHKLTHGIPREINHVCAQALLNAFVEDSRSVLPQHVASAADEIEFESVLGGDDTPESVRPQLEFDESAGLALDMDETPEDAAAEPEVEPPASHTPPIPNNPPAAMTPEVAPPSSSGSYDLSMIDTWMARVGQERAAVEPTPPPAPAPPPKPVAPADAAAPVAPKAAAPAPAAPKPAEPAPAAPKPVAPAPAAAAPAAPKPVAPAPPKPAAPAPAAAAPAAPKPVAPAPAPAAPNPVAPAPAPAAAKPAAAAPAAPRPAAPAAAPAPKPAQPASTAPTLAAAMATALASVSAANVAPKPAAPKLAAPKPVQAPPRDLAAEQMGAALPPPAGESLVARLAAMPRWALIGAAAVVVVGGALLAKFGPWNGHAAKTHTVLSATSNGMSSPTPAPAPVVKAPGTAHVSDSLATNPTPGSAMATQASNPSPNSAQVVSHASTPEPAPTTPVVAPTVAVVANPEPPPAPVVKKPAAEPAPKKTYTITAATYLEMPKAQSERAKLAASTGLPVAIAEGIDGGATVYHLQVGNYPSKTAAENAAGALSDKGLINEAQVVAVAAAKK